MNDAPKDKTPSRFLVSAEWVAERCAEAVATASAEHAARVTELLKANNAEVERRRKAEAEREQLREEYRKVELLWKEACIDREDYKQRYEAANDLWMGAIKDRDIARQALASPHAAAVNLYDNAKYRCNFCGRGFDREAALITHGDECKPAAPATPIERRTPLDMFGRTQDEADDDNWAEPSDMGAQ